MSDETIVEDKGVTVTKAFDRDGFPVPAVTFRVESDRADPVTVRIVDSIPADFGIEQIGFHPEYGSEHWTATGEGVVRFERTVDSGEAFTTVYGVKMAEDGHAEPFLGAPTLEVDPDAIDESAIDDVVPKESSDVVRELAGGERESVPGLEAEASAEQPTADSETAPAETAGDEGESVAAVADDDAVIIGENDGGPDDSTEEEADDDWPRGGEDEEQRADPLAEADDSSASDSDILEAGTTDEPGGVGDSETDPLSADPVEAESSAGAAADETASESDDDILEADAPAERESTDATGDSFDDSTEETLDEPVDDTSEEPAEETLDEPVEDTIEEPIEDQEAATTDPETPMDDELEDTPADEQDRPSATADPAATAVTRDGDESLAAALAEEIREGSVDDDDLDAIRDAVGEPTTSDGVRVDHLQARVSDLEAYTDALEAFLDENGGAEELLDEVQSTVDEVGDEIDDLASRVDAAQGEREALRERVDTLADEMNAIDDVEDRIERMSGDIEALDERVEDGEEAALAVDSLEDDLEELEDDVEEFQEWRSQLSDLFN
ncbi:MAG: hypothetical protein ACOCSF_00085 [Halanaeroarchaeum sp.]